MKTLTSNLRSLAVSAPMFAAVLIPTFAACADATTPPPPSAVTDAAGDAGGEDEDCEAGVATYRVDPTCHELEDGEPVEVLSTRKPLPVPQGGTVVPGTYVLTSFTVLTLRVPEGFVLTTAQGRLQLTADSMDESFIIEGEQRQVIRASATYVTTGTSLERTLVCNNVGGAVLTAARGYTATPTTLTLLQDDPEGEGSSYVLVYTKE